MWVPGAKVKEVEMLNGHNTELRNEAQVAALCPVVYQVSTCGLCGAGSTWAVFGTKMSCGAMRLPKRTQGEVLLCAFSGTTFGYGAMRVLCDLLVPTWGMVLPGATKGPRADEVGAGWGQGYPFAMVLGICCAVSGTESALRLLAVPLGPSGSTSLSYLLTSLTYLLYLVDLLSRAPPPTLRAWCAKLSPDSACAVRRDEDEDDHEPGDAGAAAEGGAGGAAGGDEGHGAAARLHPGQRRDPGQPEAGARDRGAPGQGGARQRRPPEAAPRRHHRQGAPRGPPPLAAPRAPRLLAVVGDVGADVVFVCVGAGVGAGVGVGVGGVGAVVCRRQCQGWSRAETSSTARFSPPRALSSSCCFHSAHVRTLASRFMHRVGHTRSEWHPSACVLCGGDAVSLTWRRRSSRMRRTRRRRGRRRSTRCASKSQTSRPRSRASNRSVSVAACLFHSAIVGSDMADERRRLSGSATRCPGPRATWCALLT
eukprot:2345486-Rhodomonas_salina.2